MGEQKYPLPEGWEWSTLEEATKPEQKRVDPKKYPELPYIGMEHIEPHTMKLLGTVPAVNMRSSADYFLAGDVLYGRLRPYLNKVYCPDFNGLCSTEFIVFRQTPKVFNKYLQYFLNSSEFLKYSNSLNAGDRPRVKFDQFAKYPFPLPPPPEQERIVVKIEELFTQLDAGVVALRRVQAGLKRYKASVLKAACEGRLVPQDPADPPASELLRELGKQPMERADLPTLPDGWCWTTVEDLAANEKFSITDGPFGSNLKTEHYTSNGPRVIRLQNIGDGDFRDEKAHISREHFERLRKHQINAGDIVIAGLGDSLPRACIIPQYVGDAIVKADCIRFKPDSRCAHTFYLLIALNSKTVKDIVAKIIHGIGRPRMNQKEIKAIPIPLPPFPEQKRIVAEVERRLSVAAEIETTVSASLKHAARLRQAVLKRAFEGRLVENEPVHTEAGPQPAPQGEPYTQSNLF